MEQMMERRLEKMEAKMDSNLEEMKEHQEMMEASQDGCLVRRDRSLPRSNRGNQLT
jgi:hypothetical protein